MPRGNRRQGNKSSNNGGNRNNNKKGSGNNNGKGNNNSGSNSKKGNKNDKRRNNGNNTDNGRGSAWSNNPEDWTPRINHNWARNVHFDDSGDVQMYGTYDPKGTKSNRYEARNDYYNEYFREFWRTQTMMELGILLPGRFVHYEIPFGQADWEMTDHVPQEELKRLFGDTEMPDVDDYAYVISSLEEVDRAHLRTWAAKRDWDLALERKKQKWALKSFKIQKRKVDVRKRECVECKALNGAHGFRFAIAGREFTLKTCSKCRLF